MKKLIGLAAIALTAASSGAFAQTVVKEDGQWRASVGLGASASSGNTSASSISVSADAVKATQADKVSLYGNALQSRASGKSTANLWRAGGRYDYNLGADMFAFGGLDFEHDKLADLSLRSGIGAGMGYHVIKSTDTTFDVFGGLGYTRDSYGTPHTIGGSTRSTYGYTNLILGEESTHKLNDSVSAKQRFVLYPNLSNSGIYRSRLDAGLSVAMTKAMNLYVGLAVRTNTDPGPGIKKTDTLLTTGVSISYN